MARNTFGNDDWMNVQRQYWEQWNDLQQQTMGFNKPPANPWEQAMDHWWSAVKGAVPPTGQDFYNKMMEQGKDFFHMAEKVMPAAGGQQSATEAWSHLLSTLTESFQQAPGMDGFRQAPGMDGFRQGTGFWEMPLDNWNRMASALSPVPGDTLRGMPTGSVKEHLDRVLGAPGLGYTRESQAQYQSFMQATLEYQEAMAEYSMLFSKIGEKSVSMLQNKVKDTPIESARQLYDTWIGCCEEVYAEQVMTPEYIALHGRLVNALMLVKSRWGEILNEYLSMLNVPTRDDLRTLQIRMQEQRRENKTLRSEVTALRKMVEQLSTAQTAAAAKDPKDPVPTVRTSRTVTKKKVSKKKVSAKKKVAASKPTSI
jgi:class III poly(R)-hydroxyalkanoic acid synthase PhaE subunit